MPALPIVRFASVTIAPVCHGPSQDLLIDRRHRERAAQMMQETDRNTGILTAIAMAAATLMIAQHIAGKATRDALFLTYFDVAQLPKIMMGSAIVSVAAVVAMSRLLTRFGPQRLIPLLYLASALLLAVQWALSDALPQIAAVALYLHVAALNSILISGFWSVINERFDPYTAKKIVPRLTAATTFGGLLGGIAAKTVASAADTHAILLMLAALHLVCAGGVAFLGRGHAQAQAKAVTPIPLLEPLKRNALIQRMALLALLVATTAAVLDYLLKAEASATLSSEDLISFFSYFYMAVGLGTFLVQFAVGNRALGWLGLGGSMAAWPVAILLTGSAALLFRSLVTVTAMRASVALLYNSFFRAGFELLYTPIAPTDKRTGKVLIDVGADRSGDLLGGLVVMTILALPVAAEATLFVAALLLAGVCLTLILVLHRGYVRQLVDNLRSGQVRAEEIEVVDATTARTVASTQAVLERDKLLRDIAALRSGASAAPAPQTVRSHGDVDRVTEAIIDLRSGDPARIQRTLASHGMTAELLPHAVRLLQDERVLREVLRALRKMASSGAGQLVDALLDPLQGPLVKRRLPLVLAHSSSPLALQGLSDGLEDPDWNVRFRCAQALEAMRRRQPQLRASEERLLRRAEVEARTLSGAGAVTLDHRVQLLFLLFGALYEPDTLELCWRALQSGDRALRGTALEYLENRLPAHVWAFVQPIVAPGHVKPTKKVTLQQAARDLAQAASALKPRSRAQDTPATDGLD